MKKKKCFARLRVESRQKLFMGRIGNCEVPFPWGSALFLLLRFPVPLHQCHSLLTAKYFAKNVFATLVLGFFPFFWMSTDQTLGLAHILILLPFTSSSGVKSKYKVALLF